MKTSLFFLLILFISSGCSNTIPFQVSDIVPAASGNVKLKKSDNNNYKIEIEVDHLAPPERLNPAAKSYIAWYLTEMGNNKIGSLVVSRNLGASLETTVPSKPKKVFITAEKDPDVDYPGNRVILETD